MRDGKSCLSGRSEQTRTREHEGLGIAGPFAISAALAPQSASSAIAGAECNPRLEIAGLRARRHPRCTGSPAALRECALRSRREFRAPPATSAATSPTTGPHSRARPPTRPVHIGALHKCHPSMHARSVAGCWWPSRAGVQQSTSASTRQPAKAYRPARQVSPAIRHGWSSSQLETAWRCRS